MFVLTKNGIISVNDVASHLGGMKGGLFVSEVKINSADRRNVYIFPGGKVSISKGTYFGR